MLNIRLYRYLKSYTRYKRHHSTKTEVSIMSSKENREIVRNLNRLYYSCKPLQAKELYEICKGRRLQFTQDDDCIQMIVYSNQWRQDTETWSGMADILNTWSVGDQIRNKLANLPNETYVIDLITETRYTEI